MPRIAAARSRPVRGIARTIPDFPCTSAADRGPALAAPIPAPARAATEPAGEPNTATRPASGITRPTMARINVLLPAPFGPSNPRHSPLRNSRVMPSTAVTWPKRLTRASIRRGSGEDEIAPACADTKYSPDFRDRPHITPTSRSGALLHRARAIWRGRRGEV